MMFSLFISALSCHQVFQRAFDLNLALPVRDGGIDFLIHDNIRRSVAAMTSQDGFTGNRINYKENYEFEDKRSGLL
jgi:hypothetical protein